MPGKGVVGTGGRRLGSRRKILTQSRSEAAVNGMGIVT
ncbi:MAG: hypothetical protein PWR22_386 [Moorella sp. (in: firmicutes)]|jgi:hypothetical protein|nr:hypothetical protein [Moorella sp. (in: firmicutes)]MDK2894320.1 hypothetical protein [Moorella sp. (in: firmicutes)]